MVWLALFIATWFLAPAIYLFMTLTKKISLFSLALIAVGVAAYRGGLFNGHDAASIFETPGARIISDSPRISGSKSTALKDRITSLRSVSMSRKELYESYKDVLRSSTWDESIAAILSISDPKSQEIALLVLLEICPLDDVDKIFHQLPENMHNIAVKGVLNRIEQTEKGSVIANASILFSKIPSKYIPLIGKASGFRNSPQTIEAFGLLQQQISTFSPKLKVEQSASIAEGGLIALSTNAPDVAAQIVSANLNQKFSQLALREVATRFAFKDPAAAMQWSLGLPPQEQEASISQVISHWTSKDKDSTGNYLNSMPASKSKDIAIQAFAVQLRGQNLDPEAVQWAHSISDPAIRESTLSIISN